MKLVQEDETERQRLMTEARQIHFASPVLLPMLDRRRDTALKRLLSNHREGKYDTNTVAELYVIESILAEIRGKLQILTTDGGN